MSKLREDLEQIHQAAEERRRAEAAIKALESAALRKREEELAIEEWLPPAAALLGEEYARELHLVSYGRDHAVFSDSKSGDHLGQKTRINLRADARGVWYIPYQPTFTSHVGERGRVRVESLTHLASLVATSDRIKAEDDSMGWN